MIRLTVVAMERREINPWQWSVEMGFQQAVEVSGEQRTLYCSGQTSVDGDGAPMHAGDMVAQVNLALDNVEAVLAGAGMTLANVVRLNMYTTDVDALMGAFEEVGERLATSELQQSGTLLGVARLAFPELMVELEATAVA
jgi:enamine deaminase RidA (YjgF/YER057c/UK114 family)